MPTRLPAGLSGGSRISGFWCSEGLSEHGIHFWSNSSGTLVERNRIINCDRGIGFGLGGSGHSGGIIRNNMLYHDSGHAHSDVGISLESAVNAKVYGNTIVHEHAYPNAIEYRFAATVNANIRNNLTNRAIVSRDGGAGFIGANHTTAQAAWFVDVASGDLHLTGRIGGVVDSGLIVADLTDDFDREARPIGAAVDIGADEWAATNSATRTIIPVLVLLLE